MKLFSSSRRNPIITCRKRGVDELVFDPNARAKLNLAKVNDMARKLAKKKGQNIPRAIIYYNENGSIDVKYFNTAEVTGYDYELVAVETFGPNGSYNLIILKDASEEQKFLELREHGDYTNVRELPQQQKPAAEQRPVYPNAAQRPHIPENGPNRIKHVPAPAADPRKPNQWKDGWESQTKSEVRQQ